ncbi:hypothetical protein Llab_0269 [Lactococcus lactis]|jgi:hypothetical protein|nr:hypothetical protein Llab_0269 [Lactococcus lactis]
MLNVDLHIGYVQEFIIVGVALIFGNQALVGFRAHRENI